jgi:malate dehydrogenase
MKEQKVARSKITVVGAGNVGAATAHIAATHDLGDIVLIDIVKGLAEGKALDLAETAPVQLFNSSIMGTMDWERTAGSDVVIITSGIARKPGMSRDDLIARNTEIVRSVTTQVVKHSPNTIIIVVCNPLDAMVYAAGKVSGLPKHRVMGMAGELDCARYNYFIASELGVSPLDVQSILMGGHGDDMVPLPRFTSVRGIPVTQLIGKEKLDAIIDRTRNGGIEVVNILGTSAYYAPGAGAVKMAGAILRDEKKIVACCAYCQKEYQAGGHFVGVPAVLGAGGVEKVIELDLNEGERKLFAESLSHVQQLVAKVDKLLG